MLLVFVESVDPQVYAEHDVFDRFDSNSADEGAFVSSQIHTLRYIEAEFVLSTPDYLLRIPIQ